MWCIVPTRAAIQQYAGLTETDEKTDARWLAHLLRLGVLRKDSSYPFDIIVTIRMGRLRTGPSMPPPPRSPRSHAYSGYEHSRA